MTISLFFFTISAISIIFSGGVTAPVGLLGETNTRILVLEVIRFEISSGIKAKSFFSNVGTGIGLASHNLTAKSYVVNLGDVSKTSSSLLSIDSIAKVILSCTPAVTIISFFK